MFELDREKIPKMKIHQSILDIYDENYVTYEANGLYFESPYEENIEHAEKAIYAWIAWYERLQLKISQGEMDY